MDVLQGSSVGDVSLESVMIMQQAEAEGSGSYSCVWHEPSRGCWKYEGSSVYPSCSGC